MGRTSSRLVSGEVLIVAMGDHLRKPVAILLGTMNGERFLASQLDSIACQTHAHWCVYASDDGSVDSTREILKHYQIRWGDERLYLRCGPQAGFAANFLSLVVDRGINADFYAYADQDDLWDPDKLARALQWLQKIPVDQPALYCARTKLIDAQGNDLGVSPLFRKPPSFANALVQSIAGGNTMVFNQGTRRLLCHLCHHNVKVVTHDWWTYLLVSGHGGTVFYDAVPAVSYRQHDENLVGSNRSWSARMSRAKKLLEGRFRDFNECNLQALQRVRSVLSVENRQLLDQFCEARHQWWLPRVLAIRRCGVYRQQPLDNFALILASLLGRL